MTPATCPAPFAGCAGGAPNLHSPAMEVGGGAREVRSEYAVSSAMGRCFRVGLREAGDLSHFALAGTQVPGSARVLLH
jgi:hypothetical protein